MAAVMMLTRRAAPALAALALLALTCGAPAPPTCAAQQSPTPPPAALVLPVLQARAEAIALAEAATLAPAGCELKLQGSCLMWRVQVEGRKVEEVPDQGKVTTEYTVCIGVDATTGAVDTTSENLDVLPPPGGWRGPGGRRGGGMMRGGGMRDGGIRGGGIPGSPGQGPGPQAALPQGDAATGAVVGDAKSMGRLRLPERDRPPAPASPARRSSGVALLLAGLAVAGAVAGSFFARARRAPFHR